MYVDVVYNMTKLKCYNLIPVLCVVNIRAEAVECTVSATLRAQNEREDWSEHAKARTLYCTMCSDEVLQMLHRHRRRKF